MEFIGQTALKTSLSQVTSKSIMIYGPKHYGKKTLVRRFYADEGANTYEITGDANDFREALNFIKVQVKPTTYIIPDLDDKNFTIQNMLLKMLEEPPLRATFCITASNFILPTIKSRCVTYICEPYTREEILEYLGEQDAEYAKFADSPGRCNLIREAIPRDDIYSAGSLRGLMTFIRNNITKNIARILVTANDIGKYISANNIPYFTFYLLAKDIYKDCDSITILTSHINELDRYIMMDFYMSLWKEYQCK